MTAFTLGEATTLALGRMRVGKPVQHKPARRGAPHPTGAPVRRDSIEAGSFEELFFAVPAKGTSTPSASRSATRIRSPISAAR